MFSLLQPAVWSIAQLSSSSSSSLLHPLRFCLNARPLESTVWLNLLLQVQALPQLDVIVRLCFHHLQLHLQLLHHFLGIFQVSSLASLYFLLFSTYSNTCSATSSTKSPWMTRMSPSPPFFLEKRCRSA